MRSKCHMKQKYVDLSILYLKYRNSYCTGFQKYQYYKSMIRYHKKEKQRIILNFD